MRYQTRGRQAVAARELVDAPEPGFGIGEGRRIQAAVVEDPMQRLRGLAELDGGAIEQAVDLGETGFVFELACEQGPHLASQHDQAGTVVAIECAERLFAGRQQAAGVLLTAMAGFECQQVGFRQGIGEAVDLVAEPVAPFPQVALGQQFALACTQLPPGAGGVRHLACQRFQPAAGVQQVELPIALQQLLVRVLAVQFEQAAGQRFELPEGGRAPVDPGLRPAIGTDHAAHEAAAAIIEGFIGQPRAGGGGIGEVIFGGEFGAFGAETHHAAVGAVSGQQAECIDQQGLSGAGFAGDHGHARAKDQFGASDHGKVVQTQSLEHGAILARGPCAGIRGPGIRDDRLRPPDARPIPRPMVPLDAPLDLRARRLLRALIHRHVSDGAPVGSRTLSQIAGLDLGPASIRSILAELERQGLVTAPHTSAGRIPTARGYRLYVDSLLELGPLAARERERLRLGLSEGVGEGGVLGRASELLSAMSRMVGVVGVPSRERLPLKHIEFVGLDAGRVLVVLVLGDDSVQNRILEVGAEVDPGLLERAASYLNQTFAGVDLGLIRERLLQELTQAQGEMERLLRQAMTLTEGTLTAVPGDVVLAGQSHLIGVSDLSDMQRLRELFEAFAGKREILQLLERTIRAPGVRVFIGEETGLAPMDGMSLVTASYASGGRVLGVLGVLGPTRMAYERMIPLVTAAADAVGAALDAPRAS